MTEHRIYTALLIASFASAPVALVVLLWVNVPYGRHSQHGWGPRLPGALGWLLMELPAVVTLPVCWLFTDGSAGAAAIALVAMWEIHYLHRALIFPWRRRKSAKPMALVIALLGLSFNVSNGYLNGRWMHHFAPLQSAGWLRDPRFIAGALIFFAGLVINIASDEKLLRLRPPGDAGYHVPRGILYRWVSCPNYLGEILEWSGFALAAWSLPGLAFAVYTAANLVPRAIAHHRWYRDRFPDYPSERTAILPGIL